MSDDLVLTFIKGVLGNSPALAVLLFLGWKLGPKLGKILENSAILLSTSIETTKTNAASLQELTVQSRNQSEMLKADRDARSKIEENREKVEASRAAADEARAKSHDTSHEIILHVGEHLSGIRDDIKAIPAETAKLVAPLVASKQPA